MRPCPPLPSRGLEKGFSDALVFKYESIPGRIASLMFQSEQKTKVKTLDETDAGLLGFSSVLGQREVCFAVADPRLFLMLQKRYMRDNNKPMPLVGFVPEISDRFPFDNISSKSLQRLHHERVIFWDPDPALAIRNARWLGSRGFIAAEPHCMPEEMYNALSRYNIHELVKKWGKTAMPWLEYLKEVLLDMSPTDGIRVLENLGAPLSSEERDTLQRLAGEKEWPKLRIFFQSDKFTRTFIYNDESFIERPGLGWFRVNPPKSAAAESLVSDAVLLVTEATMVENDLVYSGQVVFKEQVIAFTDKEATIRKDPADWITKKLVANECGLPTITAQYRKHLLDMALKNNMPKVTKQVDKVGWDRQQAAFVFPRFLVKDGVCRAHDKSEGLVTGVPAAQLQPYDVAPRPSVVEQWLTDRPENEIAWATLACVLANLVSEPSGHSKTGVVILDRHGLGSQVAGKIGQDLGLMSLRLGSDPSRLQMEQLVRLETKHDLPVLLAADSMAGSDWENWAVNSKPRNVLMVADSQTYMNLNLTGDWWGVKASDQVEPKIEGLNGLADLMTPLFLGRYRQSRIEGRPASWVRPLDILFEVVTAGQKPSNKVEFLRLQLNKRLISWGHGASGRSFLGVVFTDLAAGRLAVADAPNKRAALVHDKAAGTMLLRWEKLLKGLKGSRWYLPPQQQLEASIVDAGLATQAVAEGWVLANAVWADHYARWLQAFEPRG
jgi:hypothetical protein